MHPSAPHAHGRLAALLVALSVGLAGCGGLPALRPEGTPLYLIWLSFGMAVFAGVLAILHEDEQRRWVALIVGVVFLLTFFALLVLAYMQPAPAAPGAVSYQTSSTRGRPDSGATTILRRVHAFTRPST